eukprot:TRINITY_DN8408_c0_g3_i1.p1 TRINITY_DN8408_c0_g3~~TRINITY_DN8408_c0_g3_i1.p1  ORF type:complete len:508 (-),score=77.63 TRINITY_DN8408_c0_g3_i1:32-1555(-)
MLPSALFIGAWSGPPMITNPAGSHPRPPLQPGMEWQRVEQTDRPQQSTAIALRAAEILAQQPNPFRALCGYVDEQSRQFNWLNVTHAEWPRRARDTGCPTPEEYFLRLNPDLFSQRKEHSVGYPAIAVSHGKTQVFVLKDDVYLLDVSVDAPTVAGPFERHRWEPDLPGLKLELHFSEGTPWKMDSVVLALLVRLPEPEASEYTMFSLNLKQWHNRAAEYNLSGEPLAQRIFQEEIAVWLQALPSGSIPCSEVVIDADRRQISFFLGESLRLADNILVRHSDVSLAWFPGPLARWSASAPAPLEPVKLSEQSGRTHFWILANSFEPPSPGLVALSQMFQAGISEVSLVCTSASNFVFGKWLVELRKRAAAQPSDRFVLVVSTSVEIDRLAEMDAVAQLDLPGNLYVCPSPEILQASYQQPDWTFPVCLDRKNVPRPGGETLGVADVEQLDFLFSASAASAAARRPRPGSDSEGEVRANKRQRAGDSTERGKLESPCSAATHTAQEET